MADSVEPPTKQYQRPVRVSEDTQVLLKTGSIITGACALVVATIFVWGIKTSSEQALSEIRGFRQEMAPSLDKIQRLWWDYEVRTAGRSHGGQANP